MGCRCDFFGIFCFLFLYLLIGYVDYVCVFQILAIDQEQLLSFYILAAGYQVVLLMLIWSHLMCLCSDPGTVDLTLELKQAKLKQAAINAAATAADGSPAGCSSPCEPPRPPFPRPPPPPPRSYIGEFEWTFCRFCNVYRPPRAHHCHICRRCILLRDHHCPWINNCVGEFNQKYFLQFTSYACEFIVHRQRLHDRLHHHIMPLLERALAADEDASERSSFSFEGIIHVALLVLASVIFGIFSVAVLCDQVTGIFNDQTNHERLNGRKGPKRGRLRALRATCGYISVFLWLLPLPIGGGGGVATTGNQSRPCFSADPAQFVIKRTPTPPPPRRSCGAGTSCTLCR
ncbi:hypothetical protein TYRP_013886 [Tyrophagus putrescentiae]|nr:hypothetical protein TYRP_013886 [Tyrophagus putrescentiae]